MMGRKLIRGFLILYFLAPGLLAGCEVFDRFDIFSNQSSPTYPTVSAILTRTAMSARSKPTNYERTITSVTPRPLIQDRSTDDQKSEGCNRASAGNPIDITIPDNTSFSPGTHFSKTWRIVNTGSCSWSRGYSVVWFSGDEMAPSGEYYLSRQVDVGQSIDVTIDMTAPEKSGTYQSNWKLKTPSGYLFGIGPGGVSPFWVKILVIAGEEKTPTPTPPIPTPTMMVYSSSMTTIYFKNTLDLDKGIINPLNGFDFQFTVDNKGVVFLTPTNGAKMGIFGSQEPAMSDCQLAFLNSDPIMMNMEKQNVYYCYRTDQGLPGRFVFQKIDINRGIFEINHLTWYLP